MTDPSKSAIEMAERLLRLCRTGEVLGFVAVAETPDTIERLQGGNFELHQVIGGLAVLQQVLADEIRDGSKPVDGQTRIGVAKESTDDEKTR